MPKIEEDETKKTTRVFIPRYLGGPRPKMVLYRTWPWAYYGRQGAYELAAKLVRLNQYPKD